METATDEGGRRHDIMETWEGEHTMWHHTGCGCTLPDSEMFPARYEDAYCEKCIEYKGYRKKENKLQFSGHINAECAGIVP